MPSSARQKKKTFLLFYKRQTLHSTKVNMYAQPNFSSRSLSPQTRAAVQRSVFFFNGTATTEIYTLSLHDALPIWSCGRPAAHQSSSGTCRRACLPNSTRSEEHTSELQSRGQLVCRLLLEKKK